MANSRITVFDAEMNRLHATTHVLEKIFPEARVRLGRFHEAGSSREAWQGQIAELLAWAGNERPALLVSNIDGIAMGIVGAMMAEERELIHCVIATCEDREQTEKFLRGETGLGLSERIGHIQCASQNEAEKEWRQGKHRERFAAYFSSLPEGHPFRAE